MCPTYPKEVCPFSRHAEGTAVVEFGRGVESEGPVDTERKHGAPSRRNEAVTVSQRQSRGQLFYLGRFDLAPAAGH